MSRRRRSSSCTRRRLCGRAHGGQRGAASGRAKRTVVRARALGFPDRDRAARVAGAGGPDPRFTGEHATREYGDLLGRLERPLSVPLAHVGAPGTRVRHWREAVFANELMTGLLDHGTNPISRLTLGVLEDLGCSVDRAAADAYRLPRAAELLALGSPRAGHGHDCVIEIPRQSVLPDSALVRRPGNARHRHDEVVRLTLKGPDG